jgi:pimeloyl-ACP methyl ester carboxylesterase
MSDVSGFPAPFSMVHNGEVRLALYRWAGPQADASPILLVHGYPDSARVWQRTAAALSRQHNVYAYDVRGAGASSRPTRSEDYAYPHLLADLDAVIEAISPDAPVHLVAHDWGSIQSWEAVCDPRLAPRFASFTSMSGPAIDHVAFWLRRRLASRSLAGVADVLRQLAHSWYILLFQLPLIAPATWSLLLGARWHQVLTRLEGLRAEPSPTQTEDGRYGIGLYRANVTARLLDPQPRHTEVPVLLLQALRDPFMVAGVFDGLEAWAPRLSRREIDAGHWLPLSAPLAIAREVEAFIADQTAPVRKAARSRRR